MLLQQHWFKCKSHRSWHKNNQNKITDLIDALHSPHRQQHQQLQHHIQQAQTNNNSLDQTLIDKWNLLLLCYHPLNAQQTSGNYHSKSMNAILHNSVAAIKYSLVLLFWIHYRSTATESTTFRRRCHQSNISCRIEYINKS